MHSVVLVFVGTSSQELHRLLFCTILARKVHRNNDLNYVSTYIFVASKGVFGCNLELFQSDVDLCFLPAEKDAFVRICTRVRGLYTRLQIELNLKSGTQTSRLEAFDITAALWAFTGLGALWAVFWQHYGRLPVSSIVGVCQLAAL